MISDPLPFRAQQPHHCLISDDIGRSKDFLLSQDRKLPHTRETIYSIIPPDCRCRFHNLESCFCPKNDPDCLYRHQGVRALPTEIKHKAALPPKLTPESVPPMLRPPAALHHRIAEHMDAHTLRSSQQLRAAHRQFAAAIPQLPPASRANESTGLVRLPTELLLLIYAYLESHKIVEKEVTRTALHYIRLVSRRLYCTIPNPKPGMHFGTLKLLQHSGLASLRNMFA